MSASATRRAVRRRDAEMNCKADQRQRTLWPWLTMILAAALCLNPFGLEILQLAFNSGEALSRNIWQPIVFAGMLLLIVCAVLEWWVRRRLRRKPLGLEGQ